MLLNYETKATVKTTSRVPGIGVAVVRISP